MRIISMKREKSKGESADWEPPVPEHLLRTYSTYSAPTRHLQHLQHLQHLWHLSSTYSTYITYAQGGKYRIPTPNFTTRC